MKTGKHILLVGCIAIMTSTASYAQWTTPSGGSSWTTTGTNLIGIGTITPQARLSFENVTTDIPVGTPPNGLTWHNTAGPTGATMYGIYRSFGTWTTPNYQQLMINWQTGIVLNPGTTSSLKSFVDVQGSGMRVTSGKLFVGEHDASSTVNKASFSYAGSSTSDAIVPLVVSKKVGTSDYRRLLFIPHNIASGYSWITNDGDFSIIAHNTTGASGIVIAPSTSSWAGMRISGTGNVGIGTSLSTNPNNFALGVAANNLGTGSGIWVTTQSSAVYGVKVDVAGLSTKAFSVYNGADEKFRVTGAGVVTAKELYLIYGAFPDYVFQEDYKLMKLEDVESFIKKNKHLPNIPSAVDVEKTNIGTTELQCKLLEKIEELTLHAIEQSKQIKVLQAENKAILESIHSK